MPLTSIEQFKKKGERKIHEVKIKSLGDSVYLRELSAQDTTSWQSKFINDAGGINYKEAVKSYMPLIAASLCDSEGKVLFGSQKSNMVGDVFKAPQVTEIAQAVLEINGMSGGADEDDEGKN